MAKLSGVEKKEALSQLHGWECQGEILSQTFQWKDFKAAMRFVNAVAELAEKQNHHPDIDIRWNKVKLQWTTHDEGGLTSKDVSLARMCDELVQKLSK